MDLFDFAPTGYFLWDQQGKILELNLAGAILLGLERSTAFQKRFGQFVAVEDRPVFADFCKKVMQAKTKQTCEIKLLIDVKPLDVLIEGIAGLYRKGEGTLCRAAVIDITQRKQVDSLTKLMLASQAVLAETDLETMLQRIVNAADELIGAKFIVSGYNFCEGSFTVGATSLAARDMLKAPEKRMPLGQGVLYIELIIKEGIVRLSEQALRRYYKWNLPPGHPPLRGLLGAKLTASDGRPGGLIVLSDKTSGGEFTADDQILLAQLANIASLGLRNIDARRKAEERAGDLAAANQALEREIAAHVKTEEALRESEVRFRSMADYIYDWEYWLGPDGTSPVYVSPSCRRISGYSAEEFLNNPDLLESIVHADDREARAEHLRQAHDNPKPMSLEYRIISKDGQTRWIEHVCQPVYGPDGKCLGRRASNRDVTDRLKAEEALRESEERHQLATGVAKEAIWDVNLVTGKVQWNKAYAEFFGRPADEDDHGPWWLGQIHPEDRHHVDSSFAKALAEGSDLWVCEYRMKQADGSYAFINDRAIIVRDKTGTPLRAVGAKLNVTEQKKAVERLKLLSEVAYQLLAGDQPQQIVESLCRQVMEHLGCHVFFNYLADDETKRLRLNAYAGIPKKEARRIEWLELGAAVCGCVALEGRRIVAEHIQNTTDPRADMVRSFGIQAYACHPLMNQDRVIGTLSFGSKTKTAFSDDELAVMKTVTDHVAIAMQRIRLLESLERHASAAEAANRAKSQFFANISHDLRTPMNAILGMTELALGEAKEPSIRDYLETAKESANVLLELLNEVLDLSRMETGKFQLESTPFNLRATLDQTLKILEMRAHEKGLQLACAVADDVPDGLVGDPLRLRQVLMNLVGNAVKFTQRGEINVRIEVLSRSSEDVQLKFLVEDTGIGISTEDQDRIFIPFTQAETSTSRIYGGTGLGLTIASNLVELMGGRIWVESNLGQGSKFHFTIRLGIATAPVSSPEQPPCESLFMEHLPAAVKPLHILLAEDNPASQKLVVYILNKRGHRVEVARNGREAVEQVEREDLDAVLMDIHMSVMDGFEATSAIRALPDPAKARLPIIAMTASAMKGDQERCLAAGMDAYVSKPMSANDLITIVERLGAKTPEARAGQVREDRSSAPGDVLNRIDSQHPAPAPAANVFNLDEAITRCFRKYELFQDMVGCLFDESDSLLEQMRTELNNGDAEELGRAAHQLKGTVIFLGASPAADATRRVEQMGLLGELGNAAEAIDQLQTQIQLLKEALAPHRKTLAQP
jgi:PAS domain S-box-containing protein